jgi:hypothetical protein
MKRRVNVDRQLESLKKKARRNEVEVEDLLGVAAAEGARAVE